jgi:hypothetical protein
VRLPVIDQKTTATGISAGNLQAAEVPVPVPERAGPPERVSASPEPGLVPALELQPAGEQPAPGLV